MHALGAAALANRRRRFDGRATYVFNMHVNPANICAMGCTFCNYAASPAASHAYVMEESEILAKVEPSAADRGAHRGRVEPRVAVYAQPGARGRIAEPLPPLFTSNRTRLWKSTTSPAPPAGRRDGDPDRTQGGRYGCHAGWRSRDIFRSPMAEALAKQDRPAGLDQDTPIGPPDGDTDQCHHAFRFR